MTPFARGRVGRFKPEKLPNSAAAKKTANLPRQIGGSQTNRNFPSTLRVDDFGHLENRQKHTDYHTTNDHPQDDDKDGFDE